MTKVSRDQLCEELEKSYQNNGDLKYQLQIEKLKREVAEQKREVAEQKTDKLRLEHQVYRLTNQPSSNVGSAQNRPLRSNSSRSMEEDEEGMPLLDDNYQERKHRKVKTERAIDYGTILQDVEAEQINKLGSILKHDSTLEEMKRWCYKSDVLFPSSIRKADMYTMLSKAYHAKGD